MTGAFPFSFNAFDSYIVCCVLHRVGDYSKAVAVNRAAYELDVARASHCIAPYLPEHNVNLLIYAARCAGLQNVVDAPLCLFPVLCAVPLV